MKNSFVFNMPVKNIHKSIEFYSSLGFEIIDNHVDDNWVIMQCENFKIGLFGAILDKPTLSLHTDEFDKLAKKLIVDGIINEDNFIK